MNSKSSPSRCKRGLACRTNARTGKPAWSKVLATADPTKPLAPVIKIAVAALTRFRFPIAPELRIEHLEHALCMVKMLDSEFGCNRKAKTRERRNSNLDHRTQNRAS